MRSTTAYTAHGSIVVPEVRITEVKRGHEYHALRGSAYTMAVTEAGRCIGWVDVETLGFPSVRAWMDRK